jgi:hypothetical protein
MNLTVILTDDDPVELFIHKKALQRSQFAFDPLCFSGGRQTLDFLNGHQKAMQNILFFWMLIWCK